MSEVSQYRNRFSLLMKDEFICKENKALFKKFLEEQEYKLKRKRNLTEINDKTAKTLNAYVNRLRNVSNFFNNKPLKNITKEDIKKVYDDLEDGKILNSQGTPFKDKASYYNKIMKSRPFEMIGKDALAKEVILTTADRDSEVRFITEEDFKKILSCVIQVRHKAVLQLAWDVGENLTTLLELNVKDCRKLVDEDTKEPYYNIRLQGEFLKTGRTKRTEPTLYPETVQLLDIILQGKKPEEKLFDFTKQALEKAWHRALYKTGVRCEPDGQTPTIKDIRSGMACHLIDKDWTSDEIKSRLGHKPSSTVIDRYLNYKAKSKTRTRKKIRSFEIQRLKEEIDSIKERERLTNSRMRKLQEDIEDLETIKDLLVTGGIKPKGKPLSNEEFAKLAEGKKVVGIEFKKP